MKKRIIASRGTGKTKALMYEALINCEEKNKKYK